MKVITLWQPWASLIADGYKQFETRSWSTRYRGTLLIHAAKRRFVHDEMYQIVLAAKGTAMPHDHLQKYWIKGVPLGAIVKEARRGKLPPPDFRAVCHLADCKHMSEEFIEQQTQLERAVGFWEPGRYAWKLEGIQKLSQPIPVKGKQGLWSLSESEEKLLNIQQKEIA